jgi:hypothetical protein
MPGRLVGWTGDVAPVALGPTDATPKSSRSVSRKSFLEEFHFDAHPHPPPPSPRQRRRYRGRSRHARRHDREWRDGRFFGRCRRSRSRTINSSAIQSTTGRSAAVHPTPRRPGRVQGQEPSVPRNRDHRREARPDAANLAGSPAPRSRMRPRSCGRVMTASRSGASSRSYPPRDGRGIVLSETIGRHENRPATSEPGRPWDDEGYPTSA